MALLHQLYLLAAVGKVLGLRVSDDRVFAASQLLSDLFAPRHADR